MAPYIGNKDYPEQPSNHNHPDYPTPAYCDDLYCFQALDFVRNGAKAYNQTNKPFFGILESKSPTLPSRKSKLSLAGTVPTKTTPTSTNSPPKPANGQPWSPASTPTSVTSSPPSKTPMATAIPPTPSPTIPSSSSSPTMVARGQQHEFDANGGLRGNKGSIYEGGIRVPTLMRWPAKVHCNAKLKPGTDLHRPIDITDLLPTFCELAGAEIPLGIDGVSLAPTLTGEGYQRPREFLIHEAGKGASIIRGKHKLIRGKKGGVELYDLDQDPAETINIAEGNAELVEELEAILLNERVGEPKGFAATYHKWIGVKGNNIITPESWSEYSYTNDGIEYQKEFGIPKSHWIAEIDNFSNGEILIDKKVNFLALGVGNKSRAQKQTVLRIKDGRIVSRNGIKIFPNGKILLESGTLTSHRGVEIQEGGKLVVNGSIYADIYNSGKVTIGNPDFIFGNSNLYSVRHTGSFRQNASGRLVSYFRLDENSRHAIRLTGSAFLNGQLELVVGKKKSDKPKVGETFKLLRAKSISGKFSNPDDKVYAANETGFKIHYGEQELTLTVIGK